MQMIPIGDGGRWIWVSHTLSSAGGASASAVLHGAAASTRSVMVSQKPMVDVERRKKEKRGGKGVKGR